MTRRCRWRRSATGWLIASTTYAFGGLLGSVSSQIGQFFQRKHAAETLRFIATHIALSGTFEPGPLELADLAPLSIQGVKRSIQTVVDHLAGDRVERHAIRAGDARNVQRLHQRLSDRIDDRQLSARAGRPELPTVRRDVEERVEDGMADVEANPPVVRQHPRHVARRTFGWARPS